MLLKCLLLLTVWSVLLAEYGVDSCTVPRLAHGRVRSWQKKRLLKFMCNIGYELLGERYSSCINGRWDTPVPLCIKPSPTNCPMPKVENGYTVPSKKNAWMIFFCLPHYKLVGSPAIYCDGRQWNDTAPSCVESSIQPKLSCDFETPDLCGWSQDSLHDFDWLRYNLKTPSAFLFTGPSYDHTYGDGNMGYYMYIESTSRLENDTARFLSPIFDRELANGGCFSFYYHMYGRSIGGLRVYQKPDYLNLRTLLGLNDEERKKYLLFELWGNQGDTWFGEVAMLKNVSDNFQIVIEGIRGTSFTSDIAIDDVAILQGENCTTAVKQAITPLSFLPDSCEGRCSTNWNSSQPGCLCNAMCLVDDICCPDFFETCINNVEFTIEDSSQSPAELPQTEKLVKSTVIPPNTTPKTNTTVTITSTTSATTPKLITTTKATTTKATPKPTTKIVTTTVKNTPSTTQKAKITVTTTLRTTRTTPVVKTTKATTTPRTIRTTAKPTTKIVGKVTQPIGTTTVMKRTADTIDISKLKFKEDDQLFNKPGSSSWKPALITVAVLICVGGLLWILVGARGARGRAVLEYIRGRATNDPEVRYLHSSADDDDANY